MGVLQYRWVKNRMQVAIGLIHPGFHAAFTPGRLPQARRICVVMFSLP